MVVYMMISVIIYLLSGIVYISIVEFKSNKKFELRIKIAVWVRVVFIWPYWITHRRK